MIEAGGLEELARGVPGIDTREATERAAISVTLGATAAAAYTAQASGAIELLDGPLRDVAESMAHPLVGYVGAMIMANVGRARISTMLAGATATNFAAEFAQSQALPTPAQGDFWQSGQWPETVKDWAFALGGAGIFYAHSRYSHWRRRQA